MRDSMLGLHDLRKFPDDSNCELLAIIWQTSPVEPKNATVANSLHFWLPRKKEVHS